MSSVKRHYFLQKENGIHDNYGRVRAIKDKRPMTNDEGQKSCPSSLVVGDVSASVMCFPQEQELSRQHRG